MKVECINCDKEVEVEKDEDSDGIVCNDCMGDEELKALENMDFITKSKKEMEGYVEAIGRVKQEMIKHYKSAKYDEKLKMHYIEIGEFRYGFLAWIRKVFNLSEEDVQNAEK